MKPLISRNRHDADFFYPGLIRATVVYSSFLSFFLLRIRFAWQNRLFRFPAFESSRIAASSADAPRRKRRSPPFLLALATMVRPR